MTYTISFVDSELNEKKNFKYPRTKGELVMAELPPIEDLKITVDESKCKPVGSVFNMVDTMGKSETLGCRFWSWY